jgi:hypothetical protein
VIVVVLLSCIDLIGSALNAKNHTSVLADDMIIYYPFEGSAQDDSGNGNHGTPQGTYWYGSADRFGNIDTTFDNGSDGYVDTGWGTGFNPLNVFSVNLWVWYSNSNAEPGEQYIFGVASPFYPPVGFRFYLAKSDDSPNYPVKFVMTSTGLSSDEDSITFNGLWSEFMDAKWHMITVVHEQGTGADKLHLYVDGTQRVPTSSRDGFPGAILTQDIYILGAQDLNSPGNATGIPQYAIVDDFRFFTRVLEDFEVQALYHIDNYNP